MILSLHENPPSACRWTVDLPRRKKKERSSSELEIHTLHYNSNPGEPAWKFYCAPREYRLSHFDLCQVRLDLLARIHCKVASLWIAHPDRREPSQDKIEKRCRLLCLAECRRKHFSACSRKTFLPIGPKSNSYTNLNYISISWTCNSG